MITKRKTRKKKLFVLDTNILMHDPFALANFENNDIVIPLTVIKELDKFKVGNDSININTRLALHEIRKVQKVTTKVFRKQRGEMHTQQAFKPMPGVSLGKGKGKLYIRLLTDIETIPSPIRLQLPPDKADNAIILTAWQEHQRNMVNKHYEDVVLVTKDTNMAVAASAIGLICEDYRTDMVERVDKLYTGVQTVQGIDPNFINAVYTQGKVVWEQVPDKVKRKLHNPFHNQFFILHGGTQTVTVRYKALGKESIILEKVHDKQEYFGIMPRNIEQVLALELLLDPTIPIVTLNGKAGCGKTLFALIAAILQVENKDAPYNNIVFTRKVISMGGKSNEHGFLPGDLHDKIDPYMDALRDNLDLIKSKSKSGKLDKIVIDPKNDKTKLKVQTMSTWRGRTLSKQFIIFDEAQNLTPFEIKSIVTRMGEGSKIVFMGDIHQIDAPFIDERSNGLTYLMDRFHAKNHPMYGHLTLEKGERSPLATLASQIL